MAVRGGGTGKIFAAWGGPPRKNTWNQGEPSQIFSLYRMNCYHLFVAAPRMKLGPTKPEQNCQSRNITLLHTLGIQPFAFYFAACVVRNHLHIIRELLLICTSNYHWVFGSHTNWVGSVKHLVRLKDPSLHWLSLVGLEPVISWSWPEKVYFSWQGSQIFHYFLCILHLKSPNFPPTG